MADILLASGSPRRKELLGRLVGRFDVLPVEADENYRGDTPEETVLTIARRKAEAVPEPDRYKAIVASDTLVYMDGVYYGKPVDREDAFRMLGTLSGKTHQVYSAVVVRTPAGISEGVERSDVTFKVLSDDAINAYLDEYKPLDKAGAYAVQDGCVVSHYTGSYDNIVGLPTATLSELLRLSGVTLR